ncbi:MAG: serine hydrolase domain-containing protein, partial [Chthoniobacteraceae bacterium]
MMQSRRRFVKQLGIAGAAHALHISMRATEEPLPVLRESEEQAIAKHVREFMEKFRVPGMSMAIAREGRFVLSRGFGVADKATGAPVTPDHFFRIASVSKPITSATIFTLVEQGRLALDDLVF